MNIFEEESFSVRTTFEVIHDLPELDYQKLISLPRDQILARVLEHFADVYQHAQRVLNEGGPFKLFNDHTEKHHGRVGQKIPFYLETAGIPLTQEQVVQAILVSATHDIGTIFGYTDHAINSGKILKQKLTNVPQEALQEIKSAIATHDIKPDKVAFSFPFARLASALILADEPDIGKQRVDLSSLSEEEKKWYLQNDKHARFNYATNDSRVTVKANPTLTLNFDGEQPFVDFDGYCNLATSIFDWRLKKIIYAYFSLFPNASSFSVMATTNDRIQQLYRAERQEDGLPQILTIYENK